MIKAIALSSIVCFSTASAQTKLDGIVKDADGKALAGINITVKEKDSSSLLAFASSNERGYYLISFTSKADSIIIAASGISIKKQQMTVANRSQTMPFTLLTDTIQLKEVKVKPPRIRSLGDTLSYDVSAFTTLNDHTIGDVLKKMPGITVKEDGSISYNNKPINKFYIEGADLLQGRYGVATNNINAKDVATVEVLENHQPVKVLKNREFTDEGAINLKLKNGAKGVLVGSGQAGLGLSPLLWNSELFSMQMNKGRQNMNSYKGNNTGYNAGAELTLQYPQDEHMDRQDRLGVQSPLTPALSEKRYLFNRSNVFSFNNLWTLSKNYQINANLAYFNDRQKRNSYIRSVYYLGEDSLLTVEEEISAKEKANSLLAAIRLTENTEGRYLENVLNLNADWDSDKATVINVAAANQKVAKQFYALSNSLSWVRTIKDYNIRFNSFNGYSTTPQTMNIKPWPYGGFPGDQGAESDLRQVFEQKRFTSSTRLKIEPGSGAFKANYEAGINVSLQKIKSMLSSEPGNYSADSLVNGLNWDNYELFVKPGFVFNSKKLKATAGLPLALQYLHTTNRQVTDGNNSRLFFQPSFTLRYQFNLLLNLSLSASSQSRLGDVENGLTAYVMQSPRSISRNEGLLPRYNSSSYFVELAYRQPLREFFLNIRTGYSRGKSNLLYGYNYFGVLNVKESYNIPNVTGTHQASATLSKGIEPLVSTLRLELEYQNTSGSQINQGLLMNYSNQSFRLKPMINSKLNRWTAMLYSFEMRGNKSKLLNDMFKFRGVSSYVHRAQLNLTPLRRLVATVSYENFHNSSFTSAGKTISFADASLRYTYRKILLDLEYSNIGDARKFISASNNGTSTFYSDYELRPSQWLLKAKFKLND